MKNFSQIDLKRFEARNKIHRDNANQGEVFMANVVTSKGKLIPHPVYIIGKHGDSHDSDDVIACICTHTFRETSYDFPIELRDPSFIRTNKFFILNRDQLIHKLKNNISIEDAKNYKMNWQRAIN